MLKEAEGFSIDCQLRMCSCSGAVPRLTHIPELLCGMIQRGVTAATPADWHNLLISSGKSAFLDVFVWHEKRKHKENDMSFSLSGIIFLLGHISECCVWMGVMGHSKSNTFPNNVIKTNNRETKYIYDTWHKANLLLKSFHKEQGWRHSIIGPISFLFFFKATWQKICKFVAFNLERSKSSKNVDGKCWQACQI